MRAETKEYLPVEGYGDFSRAMTVFMPLVVLGMERHRTGVARAIARNFVCRAAMCLRGVKALWDVGDYQGCWVLYRTMLERLLVLHYLHRTSSFEAFDDLSFIKQYDARNALRGNVGFQARLDKTFFTDSPEQRARAAALRLSKPVWKKPHPKDEAARMGLGFLYTLGYDYASTLVHPMANDGQQDACTLTHLGDPMDWPDQRVVLSNSCLTALLVAQEAMVGSKLRWLGIVQRFKDEALRALGDGSKDYLRTLAQLAAVASSNEICAVPEAAKDG